MSSNSFTARAVGGTNFFTNIAMTTGLRVSGPALVGSGGAAADVLRHGSFVWTDRSSDLSITPTAQNQTIFRSSGGYWLYSDAEANAGVTLAPGAGSWTSVSDRSKKENFFDVDGEDVLRRLRNVPVTTWNYKAQKDEIRHMGPMAQDFYAAFGLDQTDKGIATIDMDGVTLAGVKALDARTEAQDARIDALEQENAELRERLERLERLLVKSGAGQQQ